MLVIQCVSHHISAFLLPAISGKCSLNPARQLNDVMELAEETGQILAADAGSKLTLLLQNGCGSL